MYRDFTVKNITLLSAMKINKEAAKRLRELRIDRGYQSAKHFAEKQGLVVETYRSYENASRNITLRAAKQLAKILNSNHYWILEGKKEQATNNDDANQAVIALTDTIKDIFTVMIHGNLCDEEFLKKTLSFRYDSYQSKNLPEAMNIMKKLQAFVTGESHLSEKSIISQLLHIPHQGSA